MNHKLLVLSFLAVTLGWLSTATAIPQPHCQNIAPPQRNLSKVKRVQIKVLPSPFSVVYAHQKNIAFVTFYRKLGVLDTSEFTPRLIHKIPLHLQHGPEYEAVGLALTNDGRYLLVTNEEKSLIVVDTLRAAKGSSNAVVGVLNGTTKYGIGALQVTVDGQYAFVSEEYGSLEFERPGTVNVFKLHLPPSKRAAIGTYIGSITLDYLVTGMALSPDGSILYVANEYRSEDATRGAISVLDVKKLKTRPSSALLSNVAAGCTPVRILVSRDGRVVWATARGSNRLLAFDAAKMLSKPSEALLASVQVGTAPEDLIFAKNESRILTADSNRFNFSKATAGLSVVDVDAALRGKQAVFGKVPTRLFPREMAISPDGGTVLVTDFNSSSIEAVDVASLP